MPVGLGAKRVRTVISYSPRRPAPRRPGFYHVAAGQRSVADMQARESIALWLARWAAAERGRFVIWLPICMAAGVVLYDAFRTEPPGWAGAALGLAALLT